MSLRNSDAAVQGIFHRRNCVLVHPFSSDRYVGSSVLMQGRSTSIVEIGRFQLQQFTVSMKELAEWFGLEVARIAVDELLGSKNRTVTSIGK